LVFYFKLINFRKKKPGVSLLAAIACDQNDYYELSAITGTGKAIHDTFIQI